MSNLIFSKLARSSLLTPSSASKRAFSPSFLLATNTLFPKTSKASMHFMSKDQRNIESMLSYQFRSLSTVKSKKDIFQNIDFKWTKINPKPDAKYGLPCERSSHGLSILKNGSLLILHGGEQIARTPLDNSQMTWAAQQTKDGGWHWKLISTFASSCSSPPPRVAHAQAAYKDSVYIFGGRQGIAMEESALCDLWRLDCTNDTFTWYKIESDLNNGDKVPEARSFHQMICVGSSLYIFGGCGENGRLADLHRYDIEANTWHTLPSSSLLEGRGGANLMTFDSSKYLGVIAGFCGREANDGHLFTVAKGSWQKAGINDRLNGLRPRSVCINASYPSLDLSLIFGGEVDPSEKGHEGAGGFENDLIILDEKSATYQATLEAPESSPSKTWPETRGIILDEKTTTYQAILEAPESSPSEIWPETRGWSDGDSIDKGDGSAKLYLYGGLSGDDNSPKRLNDLWCLDVKKS